MTTTETQELLTVEQFAQRMQVSRTTIFYWLKNGELTEGVHYFRLGRIIRFRWNESLFFNSKPLKKMATDKAKELIRPKGKISSAVPSRQAVNLDY